MDCKKKHKRQKTKHIRALHSMRTLYQRNTPLLFRYLKGAQIFSSIGKMQKKKNKNLLYEMIVFLSLLNPNELPLLLAFRFVYSFSPRRPPTSQTRLPFEREWIAHK